MPDTITLNADQTAVALRHIRDLQQAVGTIASELKDTKGPNAGLNRELAENVLKVSEYQLSDLCQILGIETDGHRERKQRHTALREANARIQELETLLGKSQGPEVTQAAIKTLCAQLTHWWRVAGLGHVSNISFQEYACSVTLSCSLFGDFPLLDSDTPVTDKERASRWRARLREQGFVLVNEDREWEIQDCDASRSTLCQLITAHLPSARVIRLDNFYRRKTNCFTLRSAELIIRDIADIAKLPQRG